MRRAALAFTLIAAVLAAGLASPAQGAGLKRVTKTYTLGAGSPQRLEVICPRLSYPLGGGMSSSPGIAANGAGVYPHSYERLGEQHGWHITPILLQPRYKPVTLETVDSESEFSTPSRRVTMQVVCAPEVLTPDATIRNTLFAPEAPEAPEPVVPEGSPPPGPVGPQRGTPVTGTARCPGGMSLLSGGFQRTNFTEQGGSYITESRAVGSRSWRVAGRTYGKFPGEIVALAYCKRGGKLLSEVKKSTSVPAGGLATVKTGGCPGGKTLSSGGFSLNGSTDAFIGDGSLNANDTWTQSAFGFFGSAQLTAYGYCIRSKVPGGG